MKTHTPGPWFVSFPADGLATRHPVISCNGETTSHVEWDGTPAMNVARAEWRGNVADTNANARLIAAAPELLAALQDLRDLNWDWFRGTAYVTVEFEQKNKAAIAKARAAINKALGK